MFIHSFTNEKATVTLTHADVKVLRGALGPATEDTVKDALDRAQMTHHKDELNTFKVFAEIDTLCIEMEEAD